MLYCRPKVLPIEGGCVDVMNIQTLPASPVAQTEQQDSSSEPKPHPGLAFPHSHSIGSGIARNCVNVISLQYLATLILQCNCRMATLMQKCFSEVLSNCAVQPHMPALSAAFWCCTCVDAA